MQNDIWALGVMALEAFTGSHPFSPGQCGMDSNVLYSIAHHKTINLPSNLSSDFAAFLRQVRAGAVLCRGLGAVCFWLCCAGAWVLGLGWAVAWVLGLGWGRAGLRWGRAGLGCAGVRQGQASDGSLYAAMSL